MIYRQFDQSQMELGVSLETSQQLSIRILSNKFVISQNQYIMETIFSFVSQPREFSALIFIIRSQGTCITKWPTGITTMTPSGGSIGRAKEKFKE